MTDDHIGLSPSASTLGCKVCGRRSIEAVCHHCGVALCGIHRNAGAEGSPEFKGLRLSAKRNTEPAHCPACAHRRVSQRMLIVTAALAGVGLALVPTVNDAVLLALLLTMPFAATLTVWLVDRGRTRQLPCPMFPEVVDETVIETYRYRITLDDDGTFRAEPGIADGVARANLRLGPNDAKRVARVRKARSSGDATAVDVTYGFMAALVQPDGAAIDLNRTTAHDAVGATVLRGLSSDTPYLDDAGASAVAAFGADDKLVPIGDTSTEDLTRLPPSMLPREIPYQIRLEPTERWSPIEIVPVLVPQSDRRVVTFNLTWSLPSDATRDVTTRWADPRRARPSRIRHLVIEAPVRLGDPEPFEPSSTKLVAAEAGTATRRIRWEAKPLTPGETMNGDHQRSAFDPHDHRRDRTPQRSTRQVSRSFTVRFENPIPPETMFTGNVAIEFDGSFAGVVDLDWFDPIGDRTPSPTPSSVTSILDADFRLSMASVHYEATFVLRERSIPGFKSAIRGVRPDHGAAIEVAQLLTKAGYYVYEVRESSFVPPDQQAALNRSWQLFGRHFSNLTPLEFQVSLEGVDVRRDGTDDTSAITDISVTAQAVYDSEAVHARFRSISENIEELAQEALYRYAGFGALQPEIDPSGDEHGDPT